MELDARPASISQLTARAVKKDSGLSTLPALPSPPTVWASITLPATAGDASWAMFFKTPTIASQTSPVTTLFVSPALPAFTYSIKSVLHAAYHPTVFLAKPALLRPAQNATQDSTSMKTSPAPDALRTVALVTQLISVSEHLTGSLSTSPLQDNTLVKSLLAGLLAPLAWIMKISVFLARPDSRCTAPPAEIMTT